MQVVIFGTTGMVGYEVLLHAIERNKTNINNQKVEKILLYSQIIDKSIFRPGYINPGKIQIDFPYLNISLNHFF